LEFAPRLRDLRQELNWYYRRIEAEQLSRETIRPEKIQRLQARHAYVKTNSSVS